MSLDPLNKNKVSGFGGAAGNENKNENKDKNTSQSIPIFPLSNLSIPNINANKDLHQVLYSQDQQARVSSTNISSNFYLITQYILEAYFGVSPRDLRTLKLVDLIVDQTYPESLTLRKLNEGASVRSYEYFNTISRQEDITRCPIFALATYFVIRWSHPNPPISVENFDRIPLLDPSAICWNRGLQKLDHNREGVKVSRSVSYEPCRELCDIIFPWLPSLRQDMEVTDRTNYKLNSFLEVFEFMARTIIQDLKYLLMNPGLLPNIVTFVAKFIPDLFEHPRFKEVNFSGSDDDAEDKDSHFLQLSKRLTTENVRLAQQITQLKTDLSNVQYMCDQILKTQQQLVGNNASNRQGGNSNGVVMLDRNFVNPSIWNNLVQNPGLGASNSEDNVQENSNLVPMLASLPLINPDINRKRKLPPPQAGLSPFPPSPGPALPSVTESPYTKRVRTEDKPTPSQTALDLLLSKTGSSPRFPSLSNNQPLKNTSRYSSPTAFAMAGSPSAVLPSNPNPLVPKTTQPEAHSHPRNSLSNFNRAVAAAVNPLSSTNVAISNFGNPPSVSEHPNAGSLPNTPMVANDSGVPNEEEDEEGGGRDGDAINDNTDEANSSKSLSPKSAVPPSAAQPSISSASHNGNSSNSAGGSLGNSNKPTEKLGPNRHIKYKLSRDNKTIWDLYTEWYIGLNGQSSIKSLIETYGLRRWKVSDDSHFFPTRRIIMDYIEMECDRGIKLGRFTNPDQPREDIRKIIVGDLEKFRINNGLTLNSLSMYFKNLTRENREICIFQNFKNWSIRAMMEEEKNKYCKRQHMKENV